MARSRLLARGARPRDDGEECDALSGIIWRNSATAAATSCLCKDAATRTNVRSGCPTAATKTGSSKVAISSCNGADKVGSEIDGNDTTVADATTWFSMCASPCRRVDAVAGEKRDDDEAAVWNVCAQAKPRNNTCGRAKIHRHSRHILNERERKKERKKERERERKKERKKERKRERQ